MKTGNWNLKLVIEPIEHFEPPPAFSGIERSTLQRKPFYCNHVPDMWSRRSGVFILLVLSAAILLTLIWLQAAVALPRDLQDIQETIDRPDEYDVVALRSSEIKSNLSHSGAESTSNNHLPVLLENDQQEYNHSPAVPSPPAVSSNDQRSVSVEDNVTTDVPAPAPAPAPGAKKEQSASEEPAEYMLNVPFYVYEELIWVDNFTFSDSNMKDARSWRRKPIVDVKKLAGFEPTKHSEDIYFTMAALRHPMRTMNASAAKLFVVPSVINLVLEQLAWSRQRFCWKETCNLLLFPLYHEILANSTWFQRYGGRDHLLVNSHYLNHKSLPKNLRACNIVTFEDRYNRNDDDRLAFPGLYVGRPCAPAVEKQHDFAMIAHLESPKFQFRRDVCHFVKNAATNYSMPICGPGVQCPTLAESKFGFHVSGDTFGSNRLIDSILSLTIPIFTQKEQYSILPDWYDWDQISFFADVTNQTSFLKAIDDALSNHDEYERKMDRLKQNKDLFDWSTDTPFDIYMYMLQVKLWPEERRNVTSKYSALMVKSAEAHEEPSMEPKGQPVNLLAEAKTLAVKNRDPKQQKIDSVQQRKPNNNDGGGGKSHIHVLIAKTIGKMDINDTLKDIEELSFRQHNISVHWKVFCFENATYEAVAPKFSNRTDVDCHFAEGRPKTYFWKEFLNPTTMIPREIEYIMMVDGDTPLRFMGWSCFWDLVHTQLKPALFMPAVMVDLPAEETSLWYAGKAHFQKCEKSSHPHGLLQKNSFQRLQAVETNVVDLQAPGFRRDAWEIVYNTFENKLSSWGSHRTDYGPDAIWCRLLESELNNGRLRDKSSFVQNWLKVQETCNVSASSPTPHSADNLICAIIHETPVYHRNTKALSFTKQTTDFDWHKTATRELDIYVETFPDFVVNRRKRQDHNRDYFRSFMGDRASSCQSCRTASCTRTQLL